MLLINQDRDIQINASEREIMESLNLKDRYSDGKYLGTNVMYNDILLGTFDSDAEAVDEMIRIITFPYDPYVVSGYSAWPDWDELIKAMLGSPLEINL